MGNETFSNLASVAIKVSGKLIDSYEGDLEEVVVETAFNLPAMATIRLHDPELKLVDDATFDIGKPIEIEMTPPGAFGTDKGTVFKGEIVALEPDFSAHGTHMFVLRAYDKAHRLFLVQRTQTYENMKDEAIVQKIAGELGLASSTDTTAKPYKYVLQYNQTDMEFLSERARRIGYLLYVQDSTLYFKKPKTTGTIQELTLGSELRSFRPRISAAQQPKEFVTRGWDPIKKTLIQGKVATNDISWVSNGEGSGGGKLAERAFRLKGTHFDVESRVIDDSNAATLAAADANMRESDFIEGDGVTYLAPTIQAGVMLNLKGLGKRFSGKYFVTSATHYFNAEGGDTHFTVRGRYPYTITDLIRSEKRSGRGGRRIDGVVPAVVTNLNDPEYLLRVRVKFPWMPPTSNGSEIESAWAKIASPDAGKERGWAFQPEVNDEVLVAFEHGDVDRPYVVGRLWNSKDKPPEQQQSLVANGKVERRVIYSRSKHKIVLDDTQGRAQITVEDSKGNYLLIDTQNDSITVKATRDITLDAGANVTIKARQNITLEAGMGIKGTAKTNIDLTANAAYNLEAMTVAIKAKAAASLEANGTLNLKSVGAANLQSSALLALTGTLIKLN